MPRSQRTTVAIVLFVLCQGIFPAWGQNDVLTQHNDNTRSGLNANEKLLTPASVNVNSFGKLFTQNVDGQIAGQPLYASQVLMNDGLVHNVVYVATQNNTVYAFDADSAQGNNASPLWAANLDNGGTPDPIGDYGCTGTHYTQIGIMGTPVIDPGKTTLYVVAKTIIGSGPDAPRNFSLHALDIGTGNERLGGPELITGTAPSGNGLATFNPVYQMQRPALLLENGVLYIGFGGNGCDQYAYNGWLFAYNSQTLQQETAFMITPNGKRGSIWQGGSGPAADADGNIYVATANGTYDSANDWGDSVLKMGWSENALSVLDYFTPYNQDQLAQQDLDLGSSGPLLLPDQPGLYPHELIAGGKQGTLYLVNRDNLGKYNSNADNVIQEIPQAVVGELIGVPTYWNNSVYVAGEGDHIKQFALVNGQLGQQPVSQTAVSFIGFGPASTSMTANANTSGILWAIKHTSPALYAFDATNLANEFWDSTQAAKARDKLVPVMRFVTPTISNGKVYVGGSATLEVYGLLSALSANPGSLSVVQGSQATSTITITPSNGFSGNVSLSASSLPSGVTAAFSPNPATSSSTLTLTASATASTGTAVVTITGTSGSLTQTTTINLTVTPAPSFALSANPGSLSIVQGNQGTSTIAITPSNGFNGSVTLSASGLPSGVTTAFSPNPATTSSALTLTASATAATGTVAVTITGTSGSLTQTTAINLTVTPAPSFTLSANPGSLSVVQGSQATSTIAITPSNGFNGSVTLSASGLPSGVTAAFSPNPATTSSSTLTLTASATAATGMAGVTITGTSGGETQTTIINLTVTAQPSFTLSANPGSLSVVQGSQGTSTIAITPSNGFNGNVSLSASGLPSGVTAAFSPNRATANSTLTLTASATAATGTAVVTITGTSGSLTETTTINLTVTPAPSFTLSANPGSLSIMQGSQATSTITIAPSNGFSGNVSLSASGLPSGVTAAFSPNPATTSSTLTLTASATAKKGTTTVTITGTTGSLSVTTTLTLKVTALGSFTLTASPSTVTVAQGGTGTSTITIVPAGGFNQQVTLSASGLPSGVTASFSTNPTSSTSTLTLTASRSTATGQSSITVTGRSESLSSSISFWLRVVP